MEIPKGGSDGNKKAGQKNKKIVYSSRKKKSPPVTAMPPPAEIQTTTTPSITPQVSAGVGEENKILKHSVDQNVQYLAEDNGNVLGNDKVASSCTVDDDLERAGNDVDIDIMGDWESADVGELVKFFLHALPKSFLFFLLNLDTVMTGWVLED